MKSQNNVLLILCFLCSLALECTAQSVIMKHPQSNVSEYDVYSKLGLLELDLQHFLFMQKETDDFTFNFLKEIYTTQVYNKVNNREDLLSFQVKFVDSKSGEILFVKKNDFRSQTKINEIEKLTGSKVINPQGMLSKDVITVNRVNIEYGANKILENVIYGIFLTEINGKFTIEAEYLSVWKDTLVKKRNKKSYIKN